MIVMSTPTIVAIVELRRAFFALILKESLPIYQVVFLNRPASVTKLFHGKAATNLLAHKPS